MKIKEITDVIEAFAPLALQESYDNAGLIVGRADAEVHRALLAVDVTEEVMDEAEREGCDMVITHHPILFHPLKRFNSASVAERCVERAICKGIALYACHTNLDSTVDGMSWHLARMLGVGELSVVQSSDAGDERIGFGVVGNLPEEVSTVDFLNFVRQRLSVRVVRHSDITRSTIRRVAVCTGSGASLARDAAALGTELYITSDLKYNDFTPLDGGMTIADIGHFESEYCVIEILFDILSKNLHTFAVRKSENSRNPINYLV